MKYIYIYIILILHILKGYLFVIGLTDAILYCEKRIYLCSVLDQLHSAIFQVDETDSHPPQQLQMFGVVCHEVLSSEWRPSHPRLPGWEKVKTFKIQDTDW